MTPASKSSLRPRPRCLVRQLAGQQLVRPVWRSSRVDVGWRTRSGLCAPRRRWSVPPPGQIRRRCQFLVESDLQSVGRRQRRVSALFDIFVDRTDVPHVPPEGLRGCFEFRRPLVDVGETPLDGTCGSPVLRVPLLGNSSSVRDRAFDRTEPLRQRSISSARRWSRTSI